MDETAASSKYLSISEFTRILKDNIENSYPYVFLRGEISNFRPSSSGHIYFSLKDQFANIRAIIFKNAQSSIFNSSNGNRITLKDGQEVLAEGRISLYERSGDYSIIITRIIPVGIGDLSIKFEMLKLKLQKEGLFDPGIKKDIPKFPVHIGIVTSPTGAALKDILHVLNRRFASMRITIFPAQVQGENAKYEIVKAINFADYHYVNNLEYKCNVLILARGGGSIEDLWPFNEETVAYAIYNAVIPIVTGIGHEIDFTIADFCADLRAPTPSAAAEIVVKNSEDLINNIASLKLRIEAAHNNYMEKIFYRMDKFRISRLVNIFEKIYQSRLQDYSYLTDKIQASFKAHFNRLKQNFVFYTGKLDSLSPLKTLARGYSLVLDKNDAIIKSSTEVNVNDELSILLSKGQLEVKVDKILEKSDKM